MAPSVDPILHRTLEAAGLPRTGCSRCTDRLAFDGAEVELAILTHHPDPGARDVARGRLVRHLDGRDRKDGRER